MDGSISPFSRSPFCPKIMRALKQFKRELSTITSCKEDVKLLFRSDEQ